MGLIGNIFKPNIRKLAENKDVEGLIKGLNYQKDGEVRKEAAHALGNIGDTRAVNPLINVLNDKIFDVQKNVIEALVKIGDPRAIEPLISILKNSSGDTFKIVADALGEIRDIRAIKPLISILKNSRGDTFKIATETLDKFWTPGNDELSAYYWITKKNWSECAKLGAPAVDQLISALNDPNEKGEWKQIIGVLGKIGDPRAVKPLIEEFEGSDENLYKAAAESLVKIGKPAVHPLINIFIGLDPFFQGSWFQYCGRPRSKEAGVLLEKIGASAIPSLIYVLNDDIHEGTKDKTAEILNNIRDPTAIEPLISGLKSSQYKTRYRVAKILINWYHNGGLSQQEKNRILEMQSIIQSPHADFEGDEYHSDNRGIGISF